MSRLTMTKKRAISAGISSALASDFQPEEFSLFHYVPEHEESLTDRVATVDNLITEILMQIGETATERTLITDDVKDFYDLALSIDKHASDIRRIINVCDSYTGDDFAEEPQTTEAFKNYYYCGY